MMAVGALWRVASRTCDDCDMRDRLARPPTDWIDALEAEGFMVEALIAQGGAARLYRGTGPGGPVALKVFSSGFGPEQLEVARRLATVDHPAVVGVMAAGCFDGGGWVAMELLEGPSLEQVLAASPLSPERALRIARRIAEGLAEIHRAGVVHRDLKPANVVLLPGDFPKIIDFGLAQPAGNAPMESIFEGSWGYAPPEQIQGRPVDPRTDVYALGVILYRMLLGRLPFGDAPVAAALGHLHDRPPPIRDRNPAIPARVEALVLRALAKSPRARFGSMVELMAELDACLEEPRPGTPGHQRPKLLTATMAVALPIALLFLAVRLEC